MLEYTYLGATFQDFEGVSSPQTKTDLATFGMYVLFYPAETGLQEFSLKEMTLYSP